MKALLVQIKNKIIMLTSEVPGTNSGYCGWTLYTAFPRGWTDHLSYPSDQHTNLSLPSSVLKPACTPPEAGSKQQNLLLVFVLSNYSFSGGSIDKESA